MTDCPNFLLGMEYEVAKLIWINLNLHKSTIRYLGSLESSRFQWGELYLMMMYYNEPCEYIGFEGAYLKVSNLAS